MNCTAPSPNRNCSLKVRIMQLAITPVTPLAIRNDEQLEMAMAVLRDLESVANSDEGAALFETWAVLIDQYEASKIVASRVDPIEILKAHMDTAGLTRADFAAVIGQSRATEILNRTRALTLDMIRRITAAWGLSADLLTASYPLRKVEHADPAAKAPGSHN